MSSETAGAAPLRARHKWVSHGLSNAVVYGGLHYGARWLPMPVLNTISVVGNSLAVTFMKKTLDGIEETYRLALGVPRKEARRLARGLFFDYGRATIDTWRLRSAAFTPKIRTVATDPDILNRCRKKGRGFLLVTGHVGNWEMGAVTLRVHGLTPAVLGQPELDPRVQEMRLALRERMGVESIDIGSSMITGIRVRNSIEAGRVVALLVDRAYPEDKITVPYFGRPTPFLRSPALLARFCDCEILPGFFVRNRDGTYSNEWGEPLAPDPALTPDADAARIMGTVAAQLERVVRRHPTQWFNFYEYWKE